MVSPFSLPLRPASSAVSIASSPPSIAGRIASPSNIEQQRRQENVLLSEQVTPPAFSSADSSLGRVAVSFSGLYGHIDTIVQRLPGPSSPAVRLSRPLPAQLDPTDPLAYQFVRGIAQIRIAGARINEIDEGHVRPLSRNGQPHLGAGIPAAPQAR